MSNAENPRAVVGDNQAAAHGEQVKDALERDYAETVEAVGKVLEDARALPKVVETEADIEKYVPVVKRIRDLAKRLGAFHQAEKEPHLSAGRAVDGFFFGLIDKLAKRDRKANPGAADVLQKRVDDYTQRRLAEEEERRKLAAEEEARKAKAAQDEADRLARAAEETRLAAERARKPETVEAKGIIADQAAAAASAAQVEATVADNKAYDAHVETLAKPADVVRQRVSSGGMLTAGTETYANILDDALLDKEALWPRINFEAKEKALRSWARDTGYMKTMTGAEVGKRAKGRVL